MEADAASADPGPHFPLRFVHPHYASAQFTPHNGCTSLMSASYCLKSCE